MQAFTRQELLVLICLLGMLAVLVGVPASAKAKARSQRLRCVDNLKQIGVAFRGFGTDLSGFEPNATNSLPPEAAPANPAPPVTHPGETSAQVSQLFRALANELKTPKILVCPSDLERSPADSFSTNFSNANVSYFIGIDNTDTVPNALLAGDRNLLINGVPVGAGIVVVQSANAIEWSAKQHIRQGNVLLGDGSAQSFSKQNLRAGFTQQRLMFP